MTFRTDNLTEFRVLRTRLFYIDCLFDNLASFTLTLYQENRTDPPHQNHYSTHPLSLPR